MKVDTMAKKKSKKQIESLGSVKVTETPPEPCLRESTLQDILDGFGVLKEGITKALNTFAHRQDDPEVARLCITYKQSIESWHRLAERDLKNCPALPLPELPTLTGNHYTRLDDLAEHCDKVVKVVVLRREPLSKNAEIVYDILVELPPHKALTVPEILDIVNEKHEKAWDEKELYERVFPQLRQWGLKNKPRIGYWIMKQESVDAPS
jgi:hypothetical protein